MVLSSRESSQGTDDRGIFIHIADIDGQSLGIGIGAIGDCYGHGIRSFGLVIRGRVKSNHPGGTDTERTGIGATEGVGQGVAFGITGRHRTHSGLVLSDGD